MPILFLASANFLLILSPPENHVKLESLRAAALQLKNPFEYDAKKKCNNKNYESSKLHSEIVMVDRTFFGDSFE